MKSFLGEVAHSLYSRYGDKISQVEILFPSRRARLFFTEALSREVDRPIWQPRWRTIDDLMVEVSGLSHGDRIRLIAELHRIYCRVHVNEPFDRFYFWGEMMLNDFDTVDKYGVDADQLFRNIEDIKELEVDISYLTPRQLQILRFWSTLGPEADLSAEKRRFLAIWRSMLPIYKAYRAALKELGFAYGGMIQREAVRKIKEEGYTFSPERRFAVVGFNALTTCEKQLFDLLQRSGQCDFYWDYDNYYVANPRQEAGMFVRENRTRYPAAEPTTYNAMEHPKTISSVAAVSNAIQCRYVANILREWAKKGPLGKETAVVLTDESLLLPLLYALPEELGKVNVTMGFPLRQTPAYTLIEALLELQKRAAVREDEDHFYHVDVCALLAHPYVVAQAPNEVAALREKIVGERLIMVRRSLLAITPVFERLFRCVKGWSACSAYLIEALEAVALSPIEEALQAHRRDYLAVATEELHKLFNSLNACNTEITDEIYPSLLRRHLQTVRIPFEGEPLAGVQVMGILETRNLDFERVIILSMTDDNFPGNHMDQSSFIPYTLRAAYELPTPEHHEGVYAYYFYRLIQRADQVCMLYCSHADDKSTGEPSRYIRQIDYESPFELQKKEVGVDVNLTPNKPIEVVKDERIMKQLKRYIDPDHPATISPTALYRYVACPLSFYFHSLAHLREREEVADEIDAPMFGTILHAAAQSLYEKVKDEANPGATLKAMMRSGEVAAAVEKALASEFLGKERIAQADYTGNLMLVRNVVTRYLQEVLRFDADADDFTVLGCEEVVDWAFPFDLDGEQVAVKFAGKVDRLDKLGAAQLRVVDFKTGSPHLTFDGLESLFLGTAKQRISNILQTLLYSMILYHNRKCDVIPSLYYVRSLNSGDYSPLFTDRARKMQGVSYASYAEEFEKLLTELLKELFNPEEPFRQCEETVACSMCSFNSICRR